MIINVKRIITLLIIAAIALILVHIAVMQARAGGMGLRALHLAFNLNLEGNIPTVFSTLLIFLSALFSWVLFQHPGRSMPRDRFWLWFALIFLFLAFDEGGQIHEKLTNVMRRVMGDHATGLFYFTWVIPYALLALLVGSFLLRSLFQQPKQVRMRLIMSGAVYFIGAFGFEMIGGSVAEADGHGSASYRWLIVAEESTEICGLLLFLWTLLQYLRSKDTDPTLRFE